MLTLVPCSPPILSKSSISCDPKIDGSDETANLWITRRHQTSIDESMNHCLDTQNTTDYTIFESWQSEKIQTQINFPALPQYMKINNPTALLAYLRTIRV